MIICQSLVQTLIIGVSFVQTNVFISFDIAIDAAKELKYFKNNFTLDWL